MYYEQFFGHPHLFNILNFNFGTFNHYFLKVELFRLC
jgi:hypothetical protein